MSDKVDVAALRRDIDEEERARAGAGKPGICFVPIEELRALLVAYEERPTLLAHDAEAVAMLNAAEADNKALLERVRVAERIMQAVRPWIRNQGQGPYLNSPILTGEDADALLALAALERSPR